MKIYMAAMHVNGYRTARYANLTEFEKHGIDALEFLLESFHYLNDKYLADIRMHGDKIFLDSGAFSAWTQGAVLDLRSYVEFCKTNIDIIRVEDGVLMASVLDGIGDDLKTWRNQLEMEARGVTPLPCFHIGEDDRFLEWYLKRYDYITIGGLVRVPKKYQMQWLDRIWGRYLTSGSGRAKVKVHGFGITSEELMYRYPWHSVDSSSWVQAAAFGSVITPDYGPVNVSEKSPSRKTVGRHIDNVSPEEREYLTAYLKSSGFEIARLRTVYETRAAYNIWSFLETMKRINATPNSDVFQIGRQELF